MSNTPFGFGLPQDPDDDGETPPGDANPLGAGNPLAALFGAAGGGPADLGAALQQLGKLLSYEGGPVNWDLARDTARQTVAAAGDRSVSDAERRAVDEAVRLAEVWLDGATGLPAATTVAQAWSRAEWVEGTLPAWQRLVEPVARKVVETAGTAVPEEMQAMAGPMVGMAQQLTGAMFGGQVGQGVGQLAGEVVTGTDVGLPLGPNGTAVLVPQNVAEFGTGLEVPEDEVRLYLALREAAHHRLFAHVSWLDAALHNAVADYAAGITVDTGRLEELVRGIDPNDLNQVQGALTEGMLAPEDTPEPTPGARPAGDPPRARRGLGRRRRHDRGHRVALGRGAFARRYDAAAPPAVRRSRPSPLSSASSCAPAGCGTRRRCGRSWPARAAPRGATRSGSTRTCCRPPRTSTTRSDSWPGDTGEVLDLSGLDDLPPSAAGPESADPDATGSGTPAS